MDLDHHHFTLDGGHAFKIHNLDHRDQLAQLLDDLLNDLLVPTRGDRHVRNAFLKRRRDIERFDVEAAPAEQPGHAGKNPGFIFHQNRQHSPHSSSARAAA